MRQAFVLLIGTEIAIRLLGAEAAGADEARQRQLSVIVRGLKQYCKWLIEEAGAT